MNTPQKIFVMVAVGSLVLFVIIIEGSNVYNWSSFFDMFYMGIKEYQNTLGLIAVFNVIVCAVGFFLFKDK
jgi:hypothetical protein